MSKPGTKRTFLKDLQDLYRKIESSTDGQARVVSASDFVIVINLRPNSGYNAHASFDFTIKCCHQYPAQCPELVFSTPIFHPNIYFPGGNICISLVNDWNRLVIRGACDVFYRVGGRLRHSSKEMVLLPFKPRYGRLVLRRPGLEHDSTAELLDIAKSMLYLIANPNFNSPNNDFGIIQDGERLEVMTKRVLAGLLVRRGHAKMPPNRAWCEWAAERGFRVEDLGDDDSAIDAKLVALSASLPSQDSIPDDVESQHSAENSDIDDPRSSRSSLNTIPSFARIRYSAPDQSNSSGRTGRYEYGYTSYDFLHIQRIIVGHPETMSPSVYYYSAILGTDSRRSGLGVQYLNPFTETIDELPDPDGGQWSYSVPWSFPYLIEHYSPYFYSSRGTSPCLELLFGRLHSKTTLTDDFCAWAQNDRLGEYNVLGSLFKRPRSVAESWDGELGNLFVPSEVSDVAIEVDEKKNEDDVDEEKKKEEEEAEEEEEEEEEEDDVDNEKKEVEVAGKEEQQEKEQDDENVVTDELFTRMEMHQDDYTEYENEDVAAFHHSPSPSRTSSNSASDGGETGNKYNDCLYTYKSSRGLVSSVEPAWQWFFRQTRWPLCIGPGQTLDVNIDFFHVPTWRASAGRLIADVCAFCSRRPEMVNLFLLDPMALSPLSPLLNMLRFSAEIKPQLSGVLWLSPMDALSPFYRVPLPQSFEAAETRICPSPTRLRLLTMAAFLSNWVNWFSRIEVYCSLGKSRVSTELPFDAVAVHLLQPYSLGCGQTPIFDLWPLWLARSLLSTVLPTILISRLIPRSKNCIFAPFSDVDEI